ncbi:peptide deformylase [Celeribacter indicus]|uniref:Peptide deformylase n=1 Tax=Celeribacter indicus TaxID=1208324 RepID=A0A0B5DX32_9RHOB|nr:peptide deformylase [Celeribacter indicus]AJE45306.1 peptide deformylase [Celeribacter indicus]SDX20327.1 peptide deformylase [Celeribacter indicus]
MAVREIVLWPDVRLSTACAPVAAITDDIRALVSDMFETMYHAPGRGLAAPQVGVMSRLFVMDATWKEGERTPFVAINPEILSVSEETCEMDEACLSIPGVTAAVTRPAGVALRWTDLDGTRQERAFAGTEARIVQHEADHLDGRVHFDRLDPKTRARLEEIYR